MSGRPRTGAVPVLNAGALGIAPRTRQLLGDYVELTKPKVQSLLLLSTIATMYVAGDPSPMLVLLTCLGGYLSAGGAGAVNHWFDRDIDARMKRTAGRPVPSGRVSARAALAFGCSLAALSLIELSLAVNPLAAALSFAGFLGYVLVYTVWLKRRTPQNIVIGGAAGAVPPLVAWAAVDGSVSATAVALFAIVFLWTPPHFWALALLLDEDYARAGVPMLPTVRGAQASARQILVYTVLLTVASLVPVALGTLSWIYAIAAALLGARFVWLALRLLRTPDDRATARRTFLYSLLYLALLFAAMGVDSALLG